MNIKSSYSMCGKLGIPPGFTEVSQKVPKRKNSWSYNDTSSMTKLWLNLRYASYQIRARDYLPGSFPHCRLTVLLSLTQFNFWRKIGLHCSLSVNSLSRSFFPAFLFISSHIRCQSSNKSVRKEQVLKAVKSLQVLWKIGDEVAVSCTK